MKKILPAFILLVIGFSGAATEIGLELVDHLEIETEEELNVILDYGILSIYSNKEVWVPLNPWSVSSTLADWAPAIECSLLSYSDIFLDHYGNDFTSLWNSAVPESDLLMINIGGFQSPQEVYLFQGEIIGRSRLAKILGMDDYFERAMNYGSAGSWDTAAVMIFLSGGMMLIGGLSEPDGMYSVNYIGMGGILGLVGIIPLVIAHSIRPTEPLWDYEQVKREIIKYNREILSVKTKNTQI